MCTLFFLGIKVLQNVQVKSSLFSTDGKVLQKNDHTPVTVADFGVQALISLGIYIMSNIKAA